MTRKRRQYGRLAAASPAILLALTLAACGSSGSSSHPSAASAASPPAAVMKALNQLTTCLSAQGVKVPSPVTRRGVRTTIRDLPSAKRSSVITACQTQVDALLALRPGH
ncbi:MAG: hypothetical protein ACR2MP_00370 [Streptosporangiaceae bacterium]